MVDGAPHWDAFTPRAAKWVLAELEEFFQMYPAWGEISLLKAGQIDHRLLSRIKKGESFRTGSVDDLYKTMGRAARGEIKPDDFRNIRTKAAPETAGKSKPRSSKESRDAGRRKSPAGRQR